MDVNVYGDVYVTYEEVEKVQDTSKRLLSVVKKDVRKRDKCCQVCGGEVNLQVHHILPLSKYEELASDEHNLIVLCQSCHDKYHSQYRGSEGADTFSKWLINGRF